MKSLSAGQQAIELAITGAAGYETLAVELIREAIHEGSRNAANTINRLIEQMKNGEPIWKQTETGFATPKMDNSALATAERLRMLVAALNIINGLNQPTEVTHQDIITPTLLEQATGRIKPYGVVETQGQLKSDDGSLPSADYRVRFFMDGDLVMQIHEPDPKDQTGGFSLANIVGNIGQRDQYSYGTVAWLQNNQGNLSITVARERTDKTGQSEYTGHATCTSPLITEKAAVSEPTV